MATQEKIDNPSSDIVVLQDDKLTEAVLNATGKSVFPAPVDERAGRRSAAEADSKFSVRKSFIENDKSDPNGFERIIGESDLTSINFLDRGRRAAAAVCRIRIPQQGGGEAYGTGFLVGARLLLTNNHVIGDTDEADRATAQFGYEHDVDGVLRTPVEYDLEPNRIFFTSTELDMTFVGVAEASSNNTPLDRYGRLPLLPMSGKVVNGEWVSIIQHPRGEPKQIAIRASQMLRLKQSDVPDINLANFIHYTTDTEPGSSGSPVVNDQWQVIALHHKAVPAKRRKNAPPDEPVQWIANEGIRISAIFNHLERLRFENPNAGLVLDRLSATLGLPPSARPVPVTGEVETEQFGPLPAAHWNKPEFGYDRDFLTTRIDLAAILKPMRAKGLTAPLLDDSGDELRYTHFSAVMHKKRKFALMTAVNIDGGKLIHPGKRKDTWRRDARIANEYQPDDEFYVRTKAQENVYFSRGHLVRLLDPCWGETLEDSRLGMEHSFHFTNAAPQFQDYNDTDWGNLEDYVLDKAQSSAKRLTVFTGPIYRKDDPLYGRKRKGGPWQIPLSYWKIAVLQKTDDRIAAAAFIVGQTEYVEALYEAKVFSGLKPYTIDEMRTRQIQTTIAAVEKESGLDFSMLRQFDARGSLESTKRTRWIQRAADVEI